MTRPDQPVRPASEISGADIVLFDLDGVLVDSLASMEHAYGAAAGDPSAPFFSAFVQLLGRPIGEIGSCLGLDADFGARYMAARSQVEHLIHLQPGVRVLLDELRVSSILLGVVTGKDGGTARRLLTKLGVCEYFGIVLGSDEVRRPKPAPDIVYAAVDALWPAWSDAVPRVLFVGDSSADITCGHLSGCLTAAALWGFEAATDLRRCGPDVCFDEPADVARFVGIKAGHA